MTVHRNQRTYTSPVRERQAEETRRQILETARKLFIEHGYVPTTVARIAQEAGVSPQTVYNSVGGKAAVLLALNDLVDEVAGIRSIQDQIAESIDPLEIVALTALLRRQLMEKAGDIVALLAVTAPLEAEVERVHRDGMERSRRGIERIVERLDALGALRQDRDISLLAESAYALLHHGHWTRLVDDCGWTPNDFEIWCAELLRRMLLDAPG